MKAGVGHHSRHVHPIDSTRRHTSNWPVTQRTASSRWKLGCKTANGCLLIEVSAQRIYSPRLLGHEDSSPQFVIRSMASQEVIAETETCGDGYKAEKEHFAKHEVQIKAYDKDGVPQPKVALNWEAFELRGMEVTRACVTALGFSTTTKEGTPMESIQLDWRYGPKSYRHTFSIVDTIAGGRYEIAISEAAYDAIVEGRRNIQLLILGKGDKGILPTHPCPHNGLEVDQQ
jgi:hypothetical protein